MGIKLTKMQGCGNDFVILDYAEFLKLDMTMAAAAKKLCDRHFGVGADGLIIPNTNEKDADIIAGSAEPCILQPAAPDDIRQSGQENQQFHSLPTFIRGGETRLCERRLQPART